MNIVLIIELLDKKSNIAIIGIMHRILCQFIKKIIDQEKIQNREFNQYTFFLCVKIKI